MNEEKSLNEREWENQDNWTLPIGIYFSKKDTRWLVPKKNKLMGWTFNLGHKKGASMFLLAFLVPTLILAGAILMTAIFNT